MKSYIALAILALSPIISATPLPSNHTSTPLINGTSTSVDVSAPHTAKGAAVINPALHEAGPDVEMAFAAGQKCISFTSDNPNWVYRLDDPWGGSGNFGRGTKQICVPRSNTAGGAMFISFGSGAPAGSTKLECFFPTTGEANCDVSLVDGYSTSVTCWTNNKGTPKIGGALNLWNTGAGCNDQSQLHQGICRNDLGYQGSQGAVSPFFQHAVQGGNNYCIWADCDQDYYFPVDADMWCHVSG